MSEHPFRAIFGTDLAPVRAKDIPAKLRSSNNGSAEPASGVEGQEVELSTIQYAEALASFKPLLDYSYELEMKYPRQPPGAGRPRAHPALGALVVWILKPHCVSERATIKELKDPANLERVRTAAATAWPDHPVLPLLDSPMSRSQYRRFAQKYLADMPDELANLCSHIRRTAAQAARHMGMLDPEDGTCSEPSPRRTAFADETFLRSRLSRSPSQCVDDNGELIHLFDPDAHNHFTNNKQDEGTRGYKVHMTGVSNGWCNQRVIIDFGIRGLDISEGNNQIERLKLLQRESPEIRDGLQALTYDRALKPVHIDAIYDLGINPILGTSLTNKGQPSTVVLQDQRFKCRDGTIRHIDVRWLHTTACVDYVDGDGYLTHQPLRRLNTLPRTNSDGSCRWYNHFEVPDNPLLPDLSGATVIVRINSTKDEREPGPPRRRTNAARVLNPTDDCYRALSGGRENIESFFSELKTPLRYRRARSITNPRVMLDLAARAAYTTVKALIHHYYETGTGADQWFGQRAPTEPRPAESRSFPHCNSPP